MLAAGKIKVSADRIYLSPDKSGQWMMNNKGFQRLLRLAPLLLSHLHDESTKS
jgi:hypothetical protein